MSPPERTLPATKIARFVGLIPDQHALAQQLTCGCSIAQPAGSRFSRQCGDARATARSEDVLIRLRALRSVVETRPIRFPRIILEQPHSIRRLLVSAFLADSIQHIHSLRASGVISSHAVNACGSDVSAFFKSAGTSCTTPPEIFFCDIDKLSFRKPQRREDLLLSKGCGSFGHPASPDAQVNSALDYPLRSCDALPGRWPEFLSGKREMWLRAHRRRLGRMAGSVGRIGTGKSACSPASDV